MGKTHPVAQDILTRGTKHDRDLIRTETAKEAKKLVDGLPTFLPDRIMAVRKIVQRALRGEIEMEVMRQFIKISGCASELEAVIPRAKMIERR